MSLPSFPSSDRPTISQTPNSGSYGGGNDTVWITGSRGPGAGNLLPKALLIVCGVCSLIATIVSVWSIILQLKGYRRPNLQRHVVRIMIMVPLYAVASFIALFSLDAAFFIDTVRDLYEAFVIYEFLQLLITYLGGERSLLILLHGRQPIPHPFPVNIFCKPMDVSDPWVLLNLKRGVLQYVQVKPLLVLATVTLKATDTYREGELSFSAGYTYVSFIYNVSICLSLYCLAMFWVAVNKDLQSFRPLPKFLCVKGILFFSFWQGLGVSFLVAVHAIKRVGAYHDAEHMSLALTDSLVCIEMPLFAIAHQYAFQASDYIDERLQYAARLPFFYAFKDAFGGKDVWIDSKATLKGQGISYQAYEPAEGSLHVGEGRRKRIRAGLRYTKGGQQKYWVAQPGDESRTTGEHGPLTSIKRKIDDRRAYREGYAPLLPHHTRRNTQDKIDRPQDDSSSDESDAPSLDFDDEGPNDSWEESMYSRARKVQYFGYPNVDVSKEKEKRKQWEEEEGVLAGKWSTRQGKSATNGKGRRNGKDKGKDKGKPDKKPGVYGKWAENSKGSPSDRTSDSSPQSSSGVPDIEIDSPRDEAEEGWVFDGENERPDAWKPPQEIQNALSNTLKWTGLRKEQDSSPQQQDNLDKRLADHHHLTPSTSPFELGSADEEEDPAEEDHVSISERPLPSDAVDLVVDDREAVNEAQNHERRKGEPATHAPKHIYRRGFLSPAEGSASNGRNSPVRGRSPSPLPGTDHAAGAHAELRPKTQGGVDTIEVGASSVEEVEPPKIIGKLASEVEENPWR